jgi:O-antigen/teichoic acid export membrane protein
MRVAGAERRDAESAAAPERLSVVRNATLLTLATFAARACTFALAIVMGRRLGVSEYGRYGFAVALGTIIVPLADLGMTGYVSREVARDRSAGEVRAVHLLAVKVSTALAALAISAAVSALLSHDARAAAVIIVVLASMLADGVSGFVFGYFQGRERMSFEASSTVLAAAVRGLGGIACVLAFDALLPVLASMLLVSAVQLAIALRRFAAAVDLGRLRQAASTAAVSWRNVFALGSITLFALVYLQADAVIIGVVYDTHAVGLYSAAYALTAGLQILPWQLAVAVAPVFARTYGADPDAFRAAWHRGLRIVLMMALPLALVTSVLAGDIMRLVFGARFHAGATALAILVWSTPVWAANMVVAGAVRGAGRDAWLVSTTSLGLLVNLGLNAWAIPSFGIDGAAAVTVGTELAVLLAQGWLLISRRVAPFPRLPYARLALAAVALAAVALATRGIEVVVAAVAALCAYTLTLVATGAISRDELRELRSLAARVR